MRPELQMNAERVSGHYLGARGTAYFGWQSRIGDAGAVLNRWKFESHISSEQVVVDFGCGGGSLLAGFEARRRIGVEVGDAARAAAAARGLETVASAAELESESADLVISNHALEHVLDPVTELQELRRALRPGGRLVLWLPLDDWRSERRHDPDDVNHHLYAWTPLLLGNLLAETGFEVHECRVVASAWLAWYTRLSQVLPRPLYRALTRVTAVCLRRRQLAAVAVRPASARPTPAPALVTVDAAHRES